MLEAVKQRETARIHLLVAKEAPIAVIIRRKPSKCFHIIKWHLKTGQFEHGSWFKGKLYPMRCDLSWDGKFMSYLAMGSKGETWNGVCEAPWLKTILESENTGTWNGGGIFWRRDEFLSNQTDDVELDKKGDWPKTIKISRLQTFVGEDESMLYHRFQRDGWKLAIEGELHDTFDSEGCFMPDHQMPWKHHHQWKPTKNHPVLQTKFVGYRGSYFGDDDWEAQSDIYEARSGRIFHFELLGYPDLLGPQVDWATWTFTGDLIWTTDGIVYQQSLDGLAEGHSPQSFDFEDLVSPKKEESS